MGKIFRSVTILNPDGTKTANIDLLIEKNTIKSIQKNIQKSNHQEIDAKGWLVTPGWKDAFTVARFPGYENKDSIQSLTNSAIAGGYTDLLLVSGGASAIDNAGLIEFMINNFNTQPVNIFPSGTISEKQEGKEITEMYDMHNSGARFFTDGIQSLQNPELLKRALLYTQPFNAKLMVYSEDQNASLNGVVNESEVSAVLGMKVRPSLAEEVELIRNIYIAEYTNTSIHFTGITSEKSVKILKEAKKKGVKITADAHIHNLYFNDKVLHSFDTQYKLLPVIRTENDRKAILKAVLDGTIDFVVSGHAPQDIESKACEFDLAEFGGATLEVNAAAIYKLVKDWKVFYELMITHPAKFMGCDAVTIKEGSETSLTFFKEEDYTVDKNTFKGISKTSPFNGQKLGLKVMGTYCKGKFNKTNV